MRHLAHVAIARGVIEYPQILRDRRAGRASWEASRQRHLQGAERREIQLRIAPLQYFHALEGVILQRIDQFRLDGAQRPVVRRCRRGWRGRPAGDLREFGWIEAAELITVIFAVGAKRRGDVEVEPHPTARSRQVSTSPGLEHRHLGVAGARRQRAQHTAAPPCWRLISSAMA